MHPHNKVIASVNFIKNTCFSYMLVCVHADISVRQRSNNLLQYKRIKFLIEASIITDLTHKQFFELPRKHFPKHFKHLLYRSLIIITIINPNKGDQRIFDDVYITPSNSTSIMRSVSMFDVFDNIYSYKLYAKTMS
jgi:hypothetical protein